MNKMIKLPIFLGICGAACGAILAGVYAFTNPIIEETAAKKAAESYVNMYKAYGVSTADVVVEGSVTLSDSLFNVGCESRAIVEKAKGVAYTCNVTGYAGPISFQVAFAEGNYIGYTNLANNETGNYGGALINKIISAFAGKPSAEKAPTEIYDYTGSSYTGRPISAAIEACRQDYLAWYAANK